MAQYIDKSALIAEIERLHKAHSCKYGCNEVALNLEYLEDFIDSLEVKEVDNMSNIRFPHYKSIVEKVFGAGNLESFEYDEAEQLVSLAKEELLKDLEVKEVDLEEIIKSYFDIKNINNVKITTTGRNLLNLAMRINKFAMNTAFEQYSQIDESIGNGSLNEEIEKIIKMNDMWCGLMPNTLIKYTAKHCFELGLKAAQKGEEV